MADIDELVVKLSADTKDLQSELRSAVAALKQSSEKMSDSVDKFATEGAQKTGMFEQALASMAGFVGGQAIIGAFKAVTGAVVDFGQALIVDGVASAIETQEALNKLTSSLARSGNLAATSATEFTEFADSLERTSRFSDDAALSAAALLENITQLDSQGLQQATQAAADLAAAMGLDLETAASLVGKAINGNTGALNRYGIEVQKGATDSQTLANVLETLNSRFGGSAASQVQTYAGSVDIMGKAWEDVTKVIGNAIVENKTVTVAVQQISLALQQFSDYLDSNSAEIQVFFGQLVSGAVDASIIVVETFKTIIGAGQLLITFWESIGTTIGTVAAAIVQAAQGDFAGAFEAIKGGAQDIKTSFEDVGNTPALDAISSKLEEMKANVDVAFIATKTGAEVAVVALNNTEAAQNRLTDAQKTAIDQAAAFAQSQIEAVDSVEERNALYLESLAAQREAELISDEEFFATKEALLMENIAAEQAQLDLALETKKINEDQYRQAQLALTLKSNTELMKNEAARQKFEEETNKKRAENFKSTLDTISTLASSGNKTLATIGKASAITTATIDGYAAVQKALASAPPPFNFALAGLVGAATAANVAKIAGTPLATGIDQVPGTGNKDNFPAILAPGERVVPRETNQDLSAFLAQQSSRPATQITMNVTMNDVFTTDPNELGQKLVTYINSALQSNGVRLLGSTV